jgi:eukaryotic translation initiation factor 2C
MYPDLQRALDAYGEMWKGAPARLVLFRDGLSEGEFEGVGAKEIKAIEGMSNVQAYHSVAYP